MRWGKKDPKKHRRKGKDRGGKGGGGKVRREEKGRGRKRREEEGEGGKDGVSW